MEQIIEQIVSLRTPLMLNGFINGKTIQIKRDNQKDTLHYGKEISLSIYDRQELQQGKVDTKLFSNQSFLHALAC